MNEIKEYNEKIFEDIKHIDKEGNEYWYARELMKVLEYSLWQNFYRIIKIAMENCDKSSYNALDHFIDVDKMVIIGSKTTRKIRDYILTRYACYLIVLNCDPRKKVIALAKTYFAIQTRNQEILVNNYNMLTEDEKRIYQRSLTKKGNYTLNQMANKAALKTLINFIMRDIKVYIMEKQQMT